MANNKKRKKPQQRRKGQPSGGPKKPPQQHPAGSGAEAPENAGPQRPPSNKPQKQAKQAARTGERRMSASERRAQARRAARRKRQMTSVIVPLVVIGLIILVLFVANGGVEGGGKVSASGDVTTGEARTDPLEAGETVPDFEAPELTDGTVRWSDYAGKPAALAVWAAWCENCQQELPVLQTLSEEFPEVPVVSIATSQRPGGGYTPESFVEAKGITFPVAVDDASGKMRQAMGVEGFPTLYFVNADGTVKEAFVGLTDEGTLRSQFQELATGASASPSPTPDRKDKDK